VQTAAPGAAYGAPACPRCADIEPVLRAHVEHVLALAALMAEAARLRRLMAESDDSPDPLVHELHACADAAQRRGVAVDIETAGVLPAVPAQARRVITDTAIAILAGARSLARVTVIAVRAGVAVSLVADSPVPAALPAAADGVVIELQEDQRSVWVEATWTCP